MPLSPGSRVGPYEVTAQIGAGGMGIVYLARDPRVGRDVTIKVSAEQFTERFERTPQRYLSTQFGDLNAVFSPDGRWLGYVSNETGRNEVYVRAFPSPVSGQGGRWQISNNGGTSPHWSRDGRDILYRAGDEILAVDYTVTGDSFVAARPRVWGKLDGATGFDLAPDGKRLLVSVPTVTTDAPKQEHTVVFLQNFFDELRRRVPPVR